MFASDAQAASERIGTLNLSRLLGQVSISGVLLGTVATVSVTPSAVADSVESLRAAVTQGRGTSCGGLRSEPLVERTANIVTQSVDKWIEHTTSFSPVNDALPILKDLGYPGGKAVLLQGASKAEADAIKSTLLEGWAAIPDCSYKDYGVSVVHNETRNEFLTAVVLAGP